VGVGRPDPVGAGLGLALPTLTAAASGAAGWRLYTVAARPPELVVGLLALTPVLVDDLDRAPPKATRQSRAGCWARPSPGP
jgi:hypothetical protein